MPGALPLGYPYVQPTAQQRPAPVSVIQPLPTSVPVEGEQADEEQAGEQDNKSPRKRNKVSVPSEHDTIAMCLYASVL